MPTCQDGFQNRDRVYSECMHAVTKQNTDPLKQQERQIVLSIINTKKNEEIENIEVSYKEQGKSSRLRLIKRMSSSWVAHFVIIKP